MFAHGSDQQLTGQSQVALLKRSGHRQGVFDQIGDFVKQSRVRIETAPSLLCRLLHTLGDQGSTPGGIGDDKMSLRRRQILLDIPDLESLGRHETMSPGKFTALKVAVAERNHCTVEQRNDPVHGPGETNVEIFPAHRLAKGQTTDQSWQNLRQQLAGRPSFHDFGKVQVFALVRFDSGQVRNLDPVAAGKTEGGLGRVAFAVESHLDRRTGHIEFLAFLMQDHAAGRNGQPTRRGKGAQIVVGDAGALQLLGEQPLKIGHGDRQKPSRNLFGTQFQEQFSRHRECSVLL